MNVKKRSAGKVLIKAELCKGCGLCIAVCPKNCLAVSDVLNKAGCNPIEFLDDHTCTACGMCFQVCPDVCIEVYREI